MSTILDDLNTVKANVVNNRKALTDQVASLQVQLDNATKTIQEMDSLSAALEVVINDEVALEAAGVNLLAAQTAAVAPAAPAADAGSPTPAA